MAFFTMNRKLTFKEKLVLKFKKKFPEFVQLEYYQDGDMDISDVIQSFIYNPQKKLFYYYTKNNYYPKLTDKRYIYLIDDKKDTKKSILFYYNKEKRITKDGKPKYLYTLNLERKNKIFKSDD